MKIEDKKQSFYCDWTFINFWLPEGILTFSQCFGWFSGCCSTASLIRITTGWRGSVNVCMELLEVFMGSLIDIELLFHFHDDDAPCSTIQFHLTFFPYVFDCSRLYSFLFFTRTTTRLKPRWNIYGEKSKWRIYLCRDFSVRSSETLLSMPYIFPSLFAVCLRCGFPSCIEYIFYVPSSLRFKEARSGSIQTNSSLPGLEKQKAKSELRKKYEIHKNSHFQEKVCGYIHVRKDENIMWNFSIFFVFFSDQFD